MRFNFVSILKFLLRIYRLDIIAELIENMEILVILDGRKLTTSIFYIIVGLKIVYVPDRHPKLGTILL